MHLIIKKIEQMFSLLCTFCGECGILNIIVNRIRRGPDLTGFNKKS